MTKVLDSVFLEGRRNSKFNFEWIDRDNITLHLTNFSLYLQEIIFSVQRWHLLNDMTLTVFYTSFVFHRIFVILIDIFKYPILLNQQEWDKEKREINSRTHTFIILNKKNNVIMKHLANLTLFSLLTHNKTWELLLIVMMMMKEKIVSGFVYLFIIIFICRVVRANNDQSTLYASFLPRGS